MRYLRMCFNVSCVLVYVVVLFSCAGDEIFTISPLTRAVMVNESVTFKASGETDERSSRVWDFGDGTETIGSVVTHEYQAPGVYIISLYSAGKHDRVKQSTVILRVHTPGTVHVPQVFLDTNARNEADDQHYIAYCGSSLE